MKKSQPLAELRKDMCRAMADLLGSGYVPSYYDSAASEFVQIAENYAAMEVQRAKKAKREKIA